MNQKKRKVFISSTYHDLIPFREKVWEILKDQDIALLGMEKFGARKSKPLETCLEEVEKSDIYVGIIAFRYGSVEESTGKSFTELEYERAIDLDKEILIYFLDKVNFPLELVDFGEKSVKLEKFKSKLKKNHTIDTFADPEQLGSKLNAKLSELIESFPQVSIRPKVIDATVHRFKVADHNCIAFVGRYNNKPIEIFAGIEEEYFFPIPKSIEKGKLIEVNELKGRRRYDFMYLDKYGYQNTIGGLSHVFEKKKQDYCKMITSLLKDGFNLSDVIKMIDKMDEFNIFEDDNANSWKKGIIKSLKNNNG